MFKFKNVGSVDRVVRIVIGVAIAVLGIVFQTWLGLIAIIPVATAFVGICPLYLPFRISTAKKAD
jgi:type IV secretory pathway TrbD component